MTNEAKPLSDEELREIWGRDAACKLVGTYAPPLTIDEPAIRQLLKDRARLLDAIYEDRATISALKADNARLREGLGKIEGGHFDGASTMVVNGDWHSAFEALQAIARMALTASQEPKI